jgi:hypothetical protein
MGLATNCGGGDEEQTGLSRSELTWIRGYGKWLDHISKAYDHADATVAERTLAAQVHAALKPLRGCSASLDRLVGSPPSGSLEEVRGLAARACSHFQRWAPLRLRLWKGLPDPYQQAPGKAGREARLAFVALEDAHEELRGALTENKALPSKTGVTGESRVEPRLGRVARWVLGGGVIDVRCWSSSDWPAVLRETAAYYPEVKVHQTAAFAYGERVRGESRGRISIGPGNCMRLARMAYAGWRPSRKDQQALLAISVVLLAHEAQHLVAVGSEAEVECAAMQDARGVARQLGAEGSYAARLAALYWREVYPLNTAEYRSPECKPGGALDYSPGGAWP